MLLVSPFVLLAGCTGAADQFKAERDVAIKRTDTVETQLKNVEEQAKKSATT